MKLIVIDNPILNSPFEEPKQHFRLERDGITNDILDGRRKSVYFSPVPEPRKRAQQPALFEEIRENDLINRIRARVGLWRDRDYPDITPTTRGLLDYWRRSDRERRLFFCQIEALETAIYFAEAAGKQGDAYLEADLRAFTAAGTPLFRVAFKMATGAGNVEVTGRREDDKQAKVDTAKKLWIPVINGEERFGRWAFLEVTDPWNVDAELRDYYTIQGK